MKLMFFGSLAVGVAMIALSTVIPASPPTSRMNLPLGVLAGGVTFIIVALAFAIWFIPALVSLRRVRALKPEAVVFVAQKTPGLGKTFEELGALVDPIDSSVPTYIVMAVSSGSIEIWRPTSSSVIARFDASGVIGLAIETVNIPKAVPAIVFTVVGVSGSPGSMKVIPCRRGSEAMAMNFKQAAELQTTIRTLLN